MTRAQTMREPLSMVYYLRKAIPEIRAKAR